MEEISAIQRGRGEQSEGGRGVNFQFPSEMTHYTLI
jgi:hypothetical protein